MPEQISLLCSSSSLETCKVFQVGGQASSGTNETDRRYQHVVMVVVVIIIQGNSQLSRFTISQNQQNKHAEEVHHPMGTL